MAVTEIEDRPSGLWRDAWRRLLRNRLAVAGLVVIAALVVVAVFGPWLSPYDFLSQNLDMRNQPPSFQHWLGTDDTSRDVLARIIYGFRLSVTFALIVALKGKAYYLGPAYPILFAAGRGAHLICWLLPCCGRCDQQARQ